MKWGLIAIGVLVWIAGGYLFFNLQSWGGMWPWFFKFWLAAPLLPLWLGPGREYVRDSDYTGKYY